MAAAAAVLLVMSGLSGCLYSMIPEHAPDAAPASSSAPPSDASSGDEYLVICYDVAFVDMSDFSRDYLDTRLAVDRALHADDTGAIVQSWTDYGEYCLSMQGADGSAMWEKVEAIIRDGPFPALRAEFYAWMSDPAPTIMELSAIDESYLPAPGLEQWVILTFERDGSEESVLDRMWETELRADAALHAAREGSSGGYEFVDGDYVLYFFGADRRAMWATLEDIVTSDPLPLVGVELLETLDGPAETIETS